MMCTAGFLLSRGPPPKAGTIWSNSHPTAREEKTSKVFLVLLNWCDVTDWSFLTTHARAMLFLANQPDARLRDVAVGLGVTERTAFGVVADLSEAGYLVKERDGRRNRYHIQRHLALRDDIGRKRSVGELLDLLGTAVSRPAARRRRS
jgi:DNA-binding MarR family transcriptional regulator